MLHAINAALLCTNGILPVAGGLLDQSAWFIYVWSTLQSEMRRIEREAHERG